MLEKTKIKLDFVVFGRLLDPKLFSDSIGIKATECWYEGEMVNNASTLKRKETAWHYTIGFIETFYVEDCTKKFLQIFSDKNKMIIKHLNNYGLNAKVEFVIEVWNEESPSIYFNKQFLKLINKLDAEIDIDLYYIGSIHETVSREVNCTRSGVSCKSKP